jgi:hypothetical protein
MVGLMVLVVPVAAAAPVDFSYTVSTHTLRYGGAGAIASVVMRTGASAETVSLGLQPSSWQDRDMYGSPLRTSDQQVTGAGRITGGFASGGGAFAEGASICDRGGPPDTGGGITLALPANSTTQVSYRVRLAAPPWPAPIFLGIAVTVPASAPYASAITRYSLGPQQFAVRGPTGVHIQLSATIGGAHRVGDDPYPVAPAGHSVTIRGTTNPEVLRGQVQVGYRATIGTRRGTIGVVTTDQHGAFHVTWKPPAQGTYTITTSYRHPAAGLLADHNCDLALTVR